MLHKDIVWVFNGAGASFPSGVFSTRRKAEDWIARHKLSGLLTAYPMDIGAFDWATERGLFKPNRPEQTESKFVGRFTSASQEHAHFEDGRMIG